MGESMVYTFGHRQSYDDAFQTAAGQQTKVYKIGRNGDYPGGSVWHACANTWVQGTR